MDFVVLKSKFHILCFNHIWCHRQHVILIKIFWRMHIFIINNANINECWWSILVNYFLKYIVYNIKCSAIKKAKYIEKTITISLTTSIFFLFNKHTKSIYPAINVMIGGNNSSTLNYWKYIKFDSKQPTTCKIYS